MNRSGREVSELMRCERALAGLSVYLDGMLPGTAAAAIARHLEGCEGCKGELSRLQRLRRELGALERVQAPPILRNLVGAGIAARESWTASLRRELEFRWSRIRSTERLWYAARLLGTACTFILFVAVFFAMNQIRIEALPQAAAAGGDLRLELGLNVLRNLGMTPLEAQRKPIMLRDPQINVLYLLSFGESVSKSPVDDSFSVVTRVDRNGAAQIQGVLEYPRDRTLLSDFHAMISSARCRPASLNGRAVDSLMVFSFSKVSVYD